MKDDSAQKAYIEFLLSAGKAVVAFENGDIIISDSPRFPQERKGAGMKSCNIETCSPGSTITSTLTIKHGARYYGHEQQDDNSCVKKNYECNDGTLDPV